MDSQPAQKKRKLNTNLHQASVDGTDVESSETVASSTPDASPHLISNVASTTDVHSKITSLSRSISPPARRTSRAPDVMKTRRFSDSLARVAQLVPKESNNSRTIKTISSPVQLSRVQELATSNNVDTIGLRDILGDPLIKECWAFNYLFDVDFLMSNFDEDVRDLVQVKVVHGSWKKEDSNRVYIDDAAKRYKNVRVLTAYMPEAFGTHHSKMFVLFRHDDHAQVVIHTANIVAGDWRMCQAVWRSPLLPTVTATPAPAKDSPTLPRIGTGLRFKHDLLSYLRAYGQSKTGPLISQLKQHDFSSIRAALIASTPSKLNLLASDPATSTLWGWPGLKNILKTIPTQTSAPQTPHIVMQVSSVATLGQTDKWLTSTFLSTLRSTSSPPSPSTPTPKASLVFPTADEIRRSLDGYSAGGSIHMKTQSAAQVKQLAYLRPLLCHWAGDHDLLPSSATPPKPAQPIREAGRRRAAPHIKTYIRFRDAGLTRIDWAMLTSANLSTQAWGAAANAAGEVRVCSYEIGVVVWPALWDGGEDGSAEMVPVFRRDGPEEGEKEGEEGGMGGGSGSGYRTEGEKDGLAEGARVKTRVGWRMPYDLPLVPYAKGEMPWCATEPCEELDWMGRKWPGFGTR